jgi:hypothetical protein
LVGHNLPIGFARVLDFPVQTDDRRRFREPFPVVFQFFQFHLGEEFFAVLRRTAQGLEQSLLNQQRNMIRLKAEITGGLFLVEPRGQRGEIQEIFEIIIYWIHGSLIDWLSLPEFRRGMFR